MTNILHFQTTPALLHPLGPTDIVSIAMIGTHTHLQLLQTLILALLHLSILHDRLLLLLRMLLLNCLNGLTRKAERSRRRERILLARRWRIYSVAAVGLASS